MMDRGCLKSPPSPPDCHNMLIVYYPVHSHASGREVTGMVPWPQRPCGILVTVRLPRFAARPGPALLARGGGPPETPRGPPAPSLRHGARAALALAGLLGAAC